MFSNIKKIYFIIIFISFLTVSLSVAQASYTQSTDTSNFFSPFLSIFKNIESLFGRTDGGSQLAQVTNDGVKYSLNGTGLQSLTYNGFQYVKAAGNSTYIIPGVMFQTPSGDKKPYGWLPDSLDKGLSVNSSVKTTGTDPDYFQQIYRDKKEDSFTVKMNWSTPDTRTAKVDIYVTNNDTVDTISKIDLEYFLSSSAFTVPGHVDSLGCNGCNVYVGPGSPIAWIHGGWGSIAMYTDDYANNSSFGSATNNNPTDGTANFIFQLRNYSSPGGSGSNTKNDLILPGQTYHYALYMRFGLSSDTPTTLAPETFSNFRNSYPYLVNWPNRAPIARWFIGDGSKNSVANPRGYFKDPLLDVTDQNKFTNKLASTTDQVLKVMNAMNPKPQGIIIWDLEGDEFNQYFTYVGYPNKLHDIAPEMDAAADQMFKKFTDAGYQIGMTLRPSSFQTGTILPATCNSDPSNKDVRDVFIKTDAVYPNRGYECTAKDTWTQTGAKNPYHQTCSLTDNVILSNLSSKVSYAKNRWGAKLFYVDSTVYCGNGGGNSFNFEIFRQLQKSFPDVIFFPENESISWWGSSAPYNQANNAVGGGVSNTPSSAKYIYPQAFSMIANYDGVNFSDPATRNKFIQSVKDGNIFMVDAWWTNPLNDKILQIYREAMGISTPTPIQTPISVPVVSNPAVIPTPQVLNSTSGGIGTNTSSSVVNTVSNTSSSYTGGGSSIILDTIPPTQPQGPKVYSVYTNQINITWSPSTDNANIYYYKIYRNSIFIGTSKTTLYSDINILPSSNYSYTISAVDASSNESTKSAPIIVITGASPSTNTVSSGVNSSSDTKIVVKKYTVVSGKITTTNVKQTTLKNNQVKVSSSTGSEISGSSSTSVDESTSSESQINQNNIFFIIFERIKRGAQITYKNVMDWVD